MTLKGRLVRDDMGSGVWVLQTDDGRRIMLDGAVNPALNGAHVVVEGDTAGGMGFGMLGGDVMRVKFMKRG